MLKKLTALTATILIIAAMIIPAALADTTDWSSPTQSQTTQWQNPTYAYADGGDYAYTDNPGQPVTYWGYTFPDLPDGSTITGIEVRLDAWISSAASEKGLDVKLSWDGGTSWTAEKKTSALTTTETTYILGGSSDTWGASWTTSIIKSNDFRVRVSPYDGQKPRPEWRLDYVAVRITYTPPTTNQPPTAAFSWSPSPGYEGSLVQFTDESTDSDGNIVSWSWDFAGLGTSNDQNPSFIFPDNGVYTVTLTVTDNGGATATVSRDVTILNVAPTVGSITILPDPPVVKVGNGITASAPFTDPGISDTHMAVWDWGDGTIDDLGTVTSPVSGSHIYSAAGVYIVKLNVTDDDGGVGTATFEYVVVYDPSAGFVTGGGWINSPAGAYAADPTLTGKATFGFVSKYQKGANVPTGNTEFQFHAAGMNFKSTSYQWLVVAGNKAMYKGSGTINGAGDYGFILSAIDGGTKGSDMFRIKIWDKSTGVVVYDNQMGYSETADPTTAIAGGSIVVHTK